MKADEKLALTISAVAFTTEPPDDNGEVVQALEEYTKTELSIEWIPNSNIDDKFNIMLASGSLPHLMYVPQKTPSFVSAVRDGAFWELGPYLNDYDNLSQANDIILNNSSIDGKIYGIYRERPLGRNAVTIRKDWLDNVV